MRRRRAGSGRRGAAERLHRYGAARLDREYQGLEQEPDLELLARPEIQSGLLRRWEDDQADDGYPSRRLCEDLLRSEGARRPPRRQDLHPQEQRSGRQVAKILTRYTLAFEHRGIDRLDRFDRVDLAGRLVRA